MPLAKEAKSSRVGVFTRIPDTIRIQAKQPRCEMPLCGLPYGEMREDTDGKIWRVVEHIHHILPRRLLNHFGYNEHSRINLISVCNKEHGMLKTAEECIFRGDVIGYCYELRRINFPLSYLWRAAREYQLEQILNLFVTECTLR